MKKIEGPYEAIGGLVGFAIGGYLGYEFADQVIQHARTMTEPDTVGYVAMVHPILTKLSATITLGCITNLFTSEVGSGIDYLVKKK